MSRRAASLLVAAVLLAGCAGQPPAPPAPAPLEWVYKGSTNYEAQMVGGGVGRRYESEAGWIDVYLYSAGRDNWLEGTSDPGFMERFNDTAAGILQAARQGHYKNVSFEKPSDVVLAGHKFRRLVARFEFREEAVESHTFLTALDGQLLKYRMSFPQPTPPDLPAIITDFIEKSVRTYEKP